VKCHSSAEIADRQIDRHDLLILTEKDRCESIKTVGLIVGRSLQDSEKLSEQQ